MYHFKMNPACGCGGYGGGCGCGGSGYGALENPSGLAIAGILAGLAVAGGAAWYFLTPKASAATVAETEAKFGPVPPEAGAESGSAVGVPNKLSSPMSSADWNSKFSKAYALLVDEKKANGFQKVETDLIGSTIYRQTGGSAGPAPRFDYKSLQQMGEVDAATMGKMAFGGLRGYAFKSGYTPEFAAAMMFLADHVVAVADGKVEIISGADANERIRSGNWVYAAFRQIRPPEPDAKKAASNKKKGKK
jgi:hypothetical protein